MSQNLLPPRLEQLIDQQGLFQEKYRLKRRLGEGSFASVIHAEHEAMGRDVALKFLRPDVLRAHPEVAKRFLMEVKLASRLTSAHTVTIFDFGESEEGVPFMVLEYVDGKTLDYAIEKYGALGLKRSIRIALQILDSLEEAHGKNIIHRDLKPANIMVAKAEAGKKINVKVLDFGVAKLVENAGTASTDKSGRHSTRFIGTPRYMSPEQILGQEICPASDLYSLGLIFYEMCTGEESITTNKVAKVAQLHLDAAPLPLEALKTLPQPVQEIILKATARKVEDRYTSAADFRKALELAVEKGKTKHRLAQTAAGEAQDGEAVAVAPDKPKVLKRTSEVFAGKAYVAPPEESEAGLARAPSVVPLERTRSAPTKPRRIPSPVEKPATVSRPGRLELDVETLEEHKRQRTRQLRSEKRVKEKAERDRGVRDLKLVLGTSLLLAVSALLSFVIVGGALAVLATPMRFGAALLPVGLALLWSVFSENAYPDLMRRRVVPWAKRSVTTLLIALVALMILMPEAAKVSLQDDGTWFLTSWPEALQFPWLLSVVQSVCDGAAWLMDLALRWFPWTG